MGILDIIIIILLIGWIGGFSFHVAGGLIHIFYHCYCFINYKITWNW